MAVLTSVQESIDGWLWFMLRYVCTLRFIYDLNLSSSDLFSHNRSHTQWTHLYTLIALYNIIYLLYQFSINFQTSSDIYFI